MFEGEKTMPNPISDRLVKLLSLEARKYQYQYKGLFCFILVAMHLRLKVMFGFCCKHWASEAMRWKTFIVPSRIALFVVAFL